MNKNRVEVKNKCRCCGGEVIAVYENGDPVGKAMAEMCDVCVKCYQAGCATLSGQICKVTGKKQWQLTKSYNEYIKLLKK